MFRVNQTEPPGAARPNHHATAPVFLQPAQWVLVEAPARLKTVLGSCVAVIMRAPRLGVTLMAHCVLPTAGATQGEVPLADVPKYVDAAIEGMLGELARRGARPGELEIKLFGGADQTIGGVTPRYGVGIRNAEMALDVLTGHGITPRATDLGGRRGRVVEFETATGAAFVRQLPAAFGARAGEKR